jgi:hypothetical protein
MVNVVNYHKIQGSVCVNAGRATPMNRKADEKTAPKGGGIKFNSLQNKIL